MQLAGQDGHRAPCLTPPAAAPQSPGVCLAPTLAWAPRPAWLPHVTLFSRLTPNLGWLWPAPPPPSRNSSLKLQTVQLSPPRKGKHFTKPATKFSGFPAGRQLPLVSSHFPKGGGVADAALSLETAPRKGLVSCAHTGAWADPGVLSPPPRQGPAEGSARGQAYPAQRGSTTTLIPGLAALGLQHSLPGAGGTGQREEESPPASSLSHSPPWGQVTVSALEAA